MGRESPERSVGNAGHRRQENPVGELNIAYFQWLMACAIRAGHVVLIISGRRAIAPAGSYLEHKSCAVKLHAYTLDSSIICASALQQKLLFPQRR